LANITGIKIIEVNDDEMGSFYSNPTINQFGLPRNSYVVFRLGAHDNDLVGPYLWNGECYSEVRYQKFESEMFGCIKPKDPYQIAYFDSLLRNQLTICTGPAGSGKSQIAMAYAFQELDKGRISKIVIFCNPYIAKDAMKFGFLPGTKTDKLLETSIGSILISKIGSRDIVEEMINREQIILMPIGDCRGYEVPKDSFVYFTESQNTSRYLMKLFLQRTNDECKIVIEGDERQQDSSVFENGYNGLTRAIEVFVGEEYAGHVQLQNNYRGRISRKAEEISS
jgi:predicted ribonuclease YlaK